MTATRRPEPHHDEVLHVQSNMLTTNTGISISLLIAVLGLAAAFWKVSRDLAVWQTKMEMRMDSLETRVVARPDPWSGTMMKEYTMQCVDRYPEVFTRGTPDVRAIQKSGLDVNR